MSQGRTGRARQRLLCPAGTSRHPGTQSCLARPDSSPGQGWTWTARTLVLAEPWPCRTHSPGSRALRWGRTRLVPGDAAKGQAAPAGREHMQTRTHMYTCMLAHIHAHSHTLMWTHSHACSHMHVLLHTCSHPHMHTSRHTHTCMFTHVHAFTHVCSHTGMHIHMHAHTHMRAHASHLSSTS